MLETDATGHLVFYMCAGCGHVGVSATNLALICHHCQTDDVTWQVVHTDDLKADLQFVAKQLGWDQSDTKG
jgi:hypothetical protein